MNCRLLGIFLFASAACAQTTQGLIAGRLIHSRTGAAVAGATVTYWHQSTGATGSALSNQAGNYFLPLLSPGVYRVRAADPRFQAQEVQQLELPVAARIELDFRMRPLNDVWESGQYRSVLLPGSQTIVTFYGPDVDTSRSGSFDAAKANRGALESTISDVVDPLEVRDLPLAGRDVYTMLVTQPGVTADAGTSRGLGLSATGQRPSSSNYLLDGMENNNYLVTGPLTAVAPEAIQEYRVSTNNFSAEYGRTAGFVANAVTRSGGNAFHGIGYFYLKNEWLNANGFQENRLGLPRPPAKENQFGFQAGGPILRNRLFFSAAFEQLRSRGREASVTYRLPTPEFVNLLGAGNSVRTLLERYPTPGPSNQGDLRVDVPYSAPVTLDRSLGLFRIDYQASEADRLMGRVSIASVDRPEFFWNPYPDFVVPFNQDVSSVVFNYTRTIRPGLLNEFKIGRGSDDLGWQRQHRDVPFLFVFDRDAQVFMPGSDIVNDYRSRSASWEFLDSLVWTRGRHIMTFGAGLLRRNIDGELNLNRDGIYVFGSSNINGLVGLILQRPEIYQVAIDRDLANYRLPNFNREYRYNQYFFFAQDTWKATRRLSLNFGLRYENFGAPSNTGQEKDVLLELGSGGSPAERLRNGRLVYGGAGDQVLYKSDPNDWAGRFGFSYSLAGDGSANLRGAYGIFYDRPFDNLWQSVRTNRVLAPVMLPTGPVDILEPPSSAIQRYRNQSASFADAVYPGVTYFRPEYRNAYAQTYFLGVQKTLGDLALEVNAAGSLGRKLTISDRWNRDLALPFGSVRYRDSQGLSNYQALSGVLRYRARRVQLHAAYTWSHSIDHQSDALLGDPVYDFSNTGVSQGRRRTESADLMLENDLRRDRGSSDFDQRHNLVFAGIWDIPSPIVDSRWSLLTRDWKVASLAAFRSGFPYSVRAEATSSDGIYTFNNRASLVRPAAELEQPREVTGGRLLLDRSAFAQPAGPGNLGRNSLIGPGLYNVDLSVARSFPIRWIGESGRLTFRADAFNLLNHSNLNNPEVFINEDTFGVGLYGRRGTRSGFPALTPFQERGRQFQMILRLEF
jgi:hypothetical protein